MPETLGERDNYANAPFLFKHGTHKFISTQSKWTPGQREIFINAALTLPIYLFMLLVATLMLWGAKDQKTWWVGLCFAIVMLFILARLLFTTRVRFKKQTQLAQGKILKGRLLSCSYDISQFTSNAAGTADIYSVQFEFKALNGRLLQGKEKVSLFKKELPATGATVLILYNDDENFVLLQKF